jgi:hypothetical protein
VRQRPLSVISSVRKDFLFPNPEFLHRKPHLWQHGQKWGTRRSRVRGLWLDGCPTLRDFRRTGILTLLSHHRHTEPQRTPRAGARFLPAFGRSGDVAFPSHHGDTTDRERPGRVPHFSPPLGEVGMLTLVPHHGHTEPQSLIESTRPSERRSRCFHYTASSRRAAFLPPARAILRAAPPDRPPTFSTDFIFSL